MLPCILGMEGALIRVATASAVLLCSYFAQDCRSTAEAHREVAADLARGKTPLHSLDVGATVRIRAKHTQGSDLLSHEGIRSIAYETRVVEVYETEDSDGDTSTNHRVAYRKRGGPKRLQLETPDGLRFDLALHYWRPDMEAPGPVRVTKRRHKLWHQPHRGFRRYKVYEQSLQKNMTVFVYGTLASRDPFTVVPRASSPDVSVPKSVRVNVLWSEGKDALAGSQMAMATRLGIGGWVFFILGLLAYFAWLVFERRRTPEPEGSWQDPSETFGNGLALVSALLLLGCLIALATLIPRPLDWSAVIIASMYPAVKLRGWRLFQCFVPLALAAVVSLGVLCVLLLGEPPSPGATVVLLTSTLVALPWMTVRGMQAIRSWQEWRNRFGSLERQWRRAQRNGSHRLARVKALSDSEANAWTEAELLWPDGSVEQAEFQPDTRTLVGDVFQLSDPALEEKPLPQAGGYRKSKAAFRRQIEGSQMDRVSTEPSASLWPFLRNLSYLALASLGIGAGAYLWQQL